MSSSVPYKNSVIVKLLRQAFSYYLLIALFVTLVHLVMEYYYVKNQIIEEINTLEASFDTILADSLWLFEERKIRLMLESMVKSPIMTGVKVVDLETQTLIAFGEILQDDHKVTVNFEGDITPSERPDSLFGTLFEIPFTIHSIEENTPLANMVIYSSASIVVDRIKHSFTIILINAMIKTTALWIIFLWIGRTLVRLPLKVLSQSTSRMVSDDEEVVKISHPEEKKLGQGKDEFGVLARNIDRMRNLFLEKMETIEKQNEILEEQVRQGNLRMDKKTKDMGDLMKGVSHMIHSIAEETPESPKKAEPVIFPVEENKRLLPIPIEKISHITVEEHYFTVFYFYKKEWRQWNTFGNLKEIDEKYPGFFVRVNRSTLINPQRIVIVNLEQEPYHLTMEGNQETPIPISKSKKKMINELLANKS